MLSRFAGWNIDFKEITKIDLKNPCLKIKLAYFYHHSIIPFFQHSD